MTIQTPSHGNGKTHAFRLADDLAGYYSAEDHRAFLKDTDMCGGLADRIVEIATEKGVRALSWDVFDTALLREPKSEARRFHIMSQAFASGLTAEGDAPAVTAVDALLARGEAARAAYHLARPRHGNREGTLERIAAITCSLLGRSDRVERYIENELTVETASLTPNPLVTALANRLPDVRMIFLTDMYLEGARVRQLLEDKFPDLEIAYVRSSADGLGSKRSGGMFDNVTAETDLRGSEILHLGDSLTSDFRMPRKAGWNSLFLPLPAPERNARRDCYDALCAEFADHGLSLPRYLAFNI